MKNSRKELEPGLNVPYTEHRIMISSRRLGNPPRSTEIVVRPVAIIAIVIGIHISG
jgi:hypothetical protein